MNFSQQVLADIKELHSLEHLGQGPETTTYRPDKPKRIEQLRAKIPTSILIHYDGLESRGKKSVAPVSNSTCGACHLQISRGALLRMQGSGEMGVCDNCNALIYLPAVALVDLLPAVQIKKPPVKKRHKALGVTVS